MNNLKRARGYYLYSQNGDRYLDIGLGCGQFVLGRKQGESQLCFKNTVEKGLTSFSDSVWLKRCQKAIPHFISFNSELSLASLTDFEFLPIMPQSIFSLKSNLNVYAEFPFNLPVWRPWLGFSCENENTENYTLAKNMPSVFVVINPFAFKEAPILLAVNKNCSWLKNFKSLDIFSSAPFLAGTTRSLYDFIKIYSAYDEKQMCRFDSVVLKYWNRKGPWLFPKMQENEYADFKEFCLSKKICISEKYSEPSFIPLAVDGGEFKKLR